MTEARGGNPLVIGGFPVTLGGVVAPTPPLDTPTASRQLALHDLFRIAETQDTIPWRPFRDGVEIHRIYGDGVSGPTAALLRFSKAGTVPVHEHTGYEHILVLAGTQRDDHGVAGPGTLVVNPPGTRHSVVSEAGCIVLAIYERPVRFLSDE